MNERQARQKPPPMNTNQTLERVLPGPTGPLPLIKRFSMIREFLPRGRMSRWADARWMFAHIEDNIHAAQRATYAIRDCGERTRERWYRLYRHEREISAISRGTDHPGLWSCASGNWVAQNN